jgi:hypothetical protein
MLSIVDGVPDANADGALAACTAMHNSIAVPDVAGCEVRLHGRRVPPTIPAWMIGGLSAGFGCLPPRHWSLFAAPAVLLTTPSLISPMLSA